MTGILRPANYHRWKCIYMAQMVRLSYRIKCYTHTSVAGCRECMESAPQDNSGGEGNVAQGTSATAFLEDNTAHMGSASLSTRNKGKKRRRASLGGGNLSTTRAPKVAGITRRAKRNRRQKAGSQDANAASSGGMSDKSSQEGRNWEVEPRMFTGGPVQHFADDTLLTRCRH